jgi:uncharacterized protein (TIGR02246 family)
VDEIRKLFDAWNAAIQTGDPDKVVALYAAKAVLVPTLSNDVRTTPEEIRQYFDVEFLPKKPRAQLDQSYPRLFGDVAINSGIYSFFFGGSTTPTQARYSFVYLRDKSGWLIIEHHSSLLYRELTDRNENFDKLRSENFKK